MSQFVDVSGNASERVAVFANEQVIQRLPKCSLLRVVGGPLTHSSHDIADEVRHMVAYKTVQRRASHEDEVGEAVLENLTAAGRLVVDVKGGVGEDLTRYVLAELRCCRSMLVLDITRDELLYGYLLLVPRAVHAPGIPCFFTSAPKIRWKISIGRSSNRSIAFSVSCG